MNEYLSKEDIRRPINIQKGVQHYQLPGKRKSKSQCDTTSHPL